MCVLSIGEPEDNPDGCDLIYGGAAAPSGVESNAGCTLFGRFIEAVA
jgi:hypothetical protein